MPSTMYSVSDLSGFDMCGLDESTRAPLKKNTWECKTRSHGR
jgi:hypothetical protein